jgi:hypothetical protein
MQGDLQIDTCGVFEDLDQQQGQKGIEGNRSIIQLYQILMRDLQIPIPSNRALR